MLFQREEGKKNQFFFQLAQLWSFLAPFGSPQVPNFRFCTRKLALFWFWDYIQLSPIIFRLGDIAIPPKDRKAGQFGPFCLYPWGLSCLCSLDWVCYVCQMVWVHYQKMSGLKWVRYPGPQGGLRNGWKQVHWLGQVNITNVQGFCIVFSSRHDFMGNISYYNGLKQEKRWKMAVKLGESDQKVIVKEVKPTKNPNNC